MYTFRPAVPQDADALLRVRRDCLSGYGVPFTPADLEALDHYRDFFLQGLADGTFVQILALAGDEIAATGSASFYRLPPIAAHPNGWEAYIGNMFTYPAHRRCGLAGQILAQLAARARAFGCGTLLLHATQAGRPIYEAFGFDDAADMMRFSLR